MTYIAYLDSSSLAYPELDAQCTIIHQYTDHIVEIQHYNKQRFAYTKLIIQKQVHTTTLTDLQQLALGPLQKAVLIKDSMYSSQQLKKACTWNPNAPPVGIISQNGSVFAGTLVYTKDTSFIHRKPHLRPGFHPASINPKLARALVHLTGLQQGVIWDPMCGVGGILLEAGLLGYTTIGTDISPTMLALAQKNMDHYQIPTTLACEDALRATYKADALICDIPYGKTTSVLPHEVLERMLQHWYTCVQRAIIVAPYDIRVLHSPWNIEHIGTEYIHKSMNKYVFRLTSEGWI
ncbi:MAG: TRM11 family SAM-dependent methyltransferase [Candidatus Woesearchaeota archaeon]